MQSESNAAPRRTKVKGKPGIYYRQVGKRRRYEVTYLDTDGRRRWQTIAGYDNLDDAEAALEEKKGRLRRGEQVRPSRATFGDLVEQWMAQLTVGERTRELYAANMRLHLLPRFERRRVQDITVDDVAKMIADMQADGKAGWTIRNQLTTLSGFFTWASSPRRGYTPANPVRQLEPRERPRVRRGKGRTLQPKEITALLDSATTYRYRVVLATATFSGLRLMELLGLRWMDVDFDEGEIRVRHQLSRKGGLAPVKSESGERDVTLRPELARVLREWKAASRFKLPGSYVFASETGGPLAWRNVERRGMDAAFEAAVKAKRLPAGRRKPVLHDCRHTFGSMLIREGHDVYTVKREMGHANASTTLDVYAGEFDKARTADASKRPNYGELLAGVGNVVETAPRNQPQTKGSGIASLSQIATG
jgi:integrase